MESLSKISYSSSMVCRLGNAHKSRYLHFKISLNNVLPFKLGKFENFWKIIYSILHKILCSIIIDALHVYILKIDKDSCALFWKLFCISKCNVLCNQYIFFAGALVFLFYKTWPQSLPTNVFLTQIKCISLKCPL